MGRGDQLPLRLYPRTKSLLLERGRHAEARGMPLQRRPASGSHEMARAADELEEDGHQGEGHPVAGDAQAQSTNRAIPRLG